MLDAAISSFFAAAVGSDTLLFSTFSFDERILAALLHKNAVASGTRIVVFHDIMKHRSPGFLRQHYSNCRIIAVEITKHNGPKRSCPVFHSKIWMAANRRDRRCHVIAAPSLNLSRYHLDKTNHTFEAFPWWKIALPGLPKVKWLTSELTSKRTGYVRLKIDPATFVIDARAATSPVLTNRSSPAIDVVREVLGHDAPLDCAAPFASATAVKALFLGKDGRVWMDRRKKDNAILHLKLIETPKFMVLGSINLTSQGLGIGRFLNHETAVIARRENIELKRLLSGFDHVSSANLTNAYDDLPGDLEEDENYEQWDKLRQLAIAGPRRVVLRSNKSKVEIHIQGGLGKAKRIEILSAAENAPHSLTVPASGKIRFLQQAQQVLLARHLLAPPVLIRGKRYGQIIWERELDLDSFWNILEKNSGILEVLRRRMQGSAKKRSESKGVPVFDDVRKARRNARRAPHADESAHAWRNWLRSLRQDLPLQAIPDWCRSLARRLRNSDG